MLPLELWLLIFEFIDFDTTYRAVCVLFRDFITIPFDVAKNLSRGYGAMHDVERHIFKLNHCDSCILAATSNSQPLISRLWKSNAKPAAMLQCAIAYGNLELFKVALSKCNSNLSTLYWEFPATATIEDTNTSN